MQEPAYFDEEGVDLSNLKSGDPHYRAYVGPALEYDFVGASQFRLLTALGLRSTHRLLDLGCGSLRAGRLFIPYLEPGNYCGIEPNRWLVEEGVRHQLGDGVVALKRPRFDHNEAFDCSVFGDRFDFILAQSIFSHTAYDLFVLGVRNAAQALADDGLLVATYVRSDQKGRYGPGRDLSGWLYPGSCTYPAEEVDAICRAAGLAWRHIPWHHPRQQWFVAGRGELPPESFDAHLTGFVWRGGRWEVQPCD